MAEVDVVAELEAQTDGDLSGFSLNDLIRAQAYVRAEYEKYKEIAAKWQKLYDYLSIRVVPARMEEEGEEAKRLTGIGRVELRSDMWTKTVDPEGLKEWLEENGMGDIVVPSVNGGTLKALIKEQMMKRDGVVPDESLVTVTPYTRAVIVKG